MRRFFNDREAAALYTAAGGKCEQCGTELLPGWHADHVVPFSRDGSTDLINGQALCPSCNSLKGDSMATGADSLEGLREWQQTVIRRYDRDGKRDFLLVATPGAGKTRVSLAIAKRLMDEGEIKRIVVVCPSEHLKTQWADAASRLGVKLDPQWANSRGMREPEDFHGIVTTYQQTMHHAGTFRRHTAEKTTFVVFDEVHHAADTLGWGDALKEAFDNASRRLALSGTPFRQDNLRIPFVDYGTEGKCAADFSYGYGQALADDVCRQVFFPSYEGVMEWMNGDGNQRASFADPLDDRESRERLRTALSPSSEWMDQVLRDAHAKLLDVREAGHPAAGALLLAIDQDHAQALAKKLQSITGVAPVVAVSDIPDASEQIERFRGGSSEWLVSVKMVSEGVDIPRLRVLVYATNVLSELFFRQAVGRIVRCQDELDEQSAHFFIPADATLKAFANEIQKERTHALDNEVEMLKRENSDTKTAQQSLYAPISAEATAHDVVFDGEVVTQQELQRATRYLERRPVRQLQAAALALLLRVIEPLAQKAANPDPGPEYHHHREREKLRRLLNKLVGRLVAEAASDAVKHSTIHHRLATATDGKPVGQATVETIQRRVELVGEWIRERRSGR